MMKIIISWPSEETYRACTFCFFGFFWVFFYFSAINVQVVKQATCYTAKCNRRFDQWLGIRVVAFLRRYRSFVNICPCVCVCLSLCACMCVYMCSYMCVCLCVPLKVRPSMCVRMRVSVCACGFHSVRAKAFNSNGRHVAAAAAAAAGKDEIVKKQQEQRWLQKDYLMIWRHLRKRKISPSHSRNTNQVNAIREILLRHLNFYCWLF